VQKVTENYGDDDQDALSCDGMQMQDFHHYRHRTQAEDDGSAVAHVEAQELARQAAATAEHQQFVADEGVAHRDEMRDQHDDEVMQHMVQQEIRDNEHHIAEGGVPGADDEEARLFAALP